MSASPDWEPEMSNTLHVMPPEPTSVKPSTSSAWAGSAWAASARDPI